MRFTSEQKKGLERMMKWFELLASVDIGDHLMVNTNCITDTPLSHCGMWLRNRMTCDTYDTNQQEILNSLRLLYLKNYGVMTWDELILDTTKL